MTTVEIDLDEVSDWRHDMVHTTPVGGLARFDRSPDILRTLRDIRALLTALAVLVAISGTFITWNLTEMRADAKRPVAVAMTQGNAIPVAARRVQLQITGDPYAEAIGHIAYMDGSESEYAPGVYSVTALDGARIDLTADSGFSTCRITVDGEMVSEQTAVNQQTVTCHWEAS